MNPHYLFNDAIGKLTSQIARSLREPTSCDRPMKTRCVYGKSHEARKEKENRIITAPGVTIIPDMLALSFVKVSFGMPP